MAPDNIQAWNTSRILSAKNKKKYKKSDLFFVFNGWLLSADLGNVSVETKRLAIGVVALYC